MTWYAFIGDGHVYDLNGVAQTELQTADPGIHGYSTEQGALENPNSPPNAEAAVLLGQFQQEAKLPAGAGSLGVLAVYQVTQPKGTGKGGVGQSQQQAQSDISNQKQVTTPSLLGTLAGFLGLPAGTNISGTNLVIRGAKIIIGGALVLIGISHMFGLDNAVANAARRVPLPI